MQDFCDSTGRTRRRNREGTPVIASWKGAEKGEFSYSSLLKKDNLGDIMKMIDPPLRSLSNEDARKWYLDRDAEIPNLIDRSQSIEDQARQACAMRNQNRTKARELMADQETRKVLDEKSPNKTFEELITDKMARKHLSREEAITDILKTATKTNQAVNDQFGLKGEGST